MIAVVNFLLCLGIAIVGGLGSASYMITSGSPLTTRQIGPWQVWKDAGRVEADPYTRAHFSTSGRLPAGSRNALYFLANRDSAGATLALNCEYTIGGLGPDAQWWSLSAYDMAGQLFTNSANRYAYSGTTVMRATDGTFAITVARDARPGNWLPVAGSGTFRLMLSVYGLEAEDPRRASANSAGLPFIRRGTCR